MPLGNYVILKPDTGERMHFVEHRIEPRTVTDNVTLRPKAVNVLVLSVDRLNGQAVAAQFSTMSETLYAKLEAYLAGNVYRNYEFIITQRGTGFQTRYTVEAIPLVTR